MNLQDKYKVYLKDIRRYSARTVGLYSSAVDDFLEWALEDLLQPSEKDVLDVLKPNMIRGYEAHLMGGRKPRSARTVSLHLSALSGFCRFLMKEGKMKSNPVRIVPKPKIEKRLPHFFRKEAMAAYFSHTSWMLDSDALNAFISAPDTDSGKEYYDGLLARVIVSTLYSLGIRRSELISLRVGDVDFGRNVVKVRGKGDKMREIPLIVSLSEELLLYLKAVEVMCGRKRSLTESLFVTYKGSPLYPVYVDRTVKKELEDVEGISGRRSPHVLRHSIATGLMNEDVHLNSIKEMLGHSSLASTQVYTHTSIARLKIIYEQAHPRAKNGGKNGD